MKCANSRFLGVVFGSCFLLSPHAYQHMQIKKTFEASVDGSAKMEKKNERGERGLRSRLLRT